MAWTEPPRTWTTTELVTAAIMNTHVRDQLAYLLRTAVIDHDNNTAFTFTNTTYLDLDAVTGGTAGSAVAVSFTSPNAGNVQVTVGGQLANGTLGARTFLGYRISGATTLASDDNDALAFESDPATTNSQSSWVTYPSVNAGSNTYELQGRVTSGTATVARTQIAVALV